MCLNTLFGLPMKKERCGYIIYSGTKTGRCYNIIHAAAQRPVSKHTLFCMAWRFSCQSVLLRALGNNHKSRA